MTQEDKNLLLQDLCTRLPYGVTCQFTWTYCNETTDGEVVIAIENDNIRNIDINIKEVRADYYDEWVDLENCKPYLRPISSMTDEEFEDLKSYSGLIYNQLDLASYQNGTYKCLDFYLSEIPSDVVILVFDWLNSHHFDYRGLIENGLALEAPEGMYN